MVLNLASCENSNQNGQTSAGNGGIHTNTPTPTNTPTQNPEPTTIPQTDPTPSPTITPTEPAQAFNYDDNEAIKRMILLLHNDYRRVHNLSPLKYSDKMEELAALHANKMRESVICSNWTMMDNRTEEQNPHKCPGELGLGDRKDSLGLQNWGVAENIHTENSQSENFVLTSFTWPVAGWIYSPSHEKNMRGNYEYFGVYWIHNPITKNLHYVAIYGKEFVDE